MPAITSRHSTVISHRRDLGRVAISAGSRVNESIRNLKPQGSDIGTRPGDANASSDIPSDRKGEAARYQARLQARELIFDRSGGLNPATAHRLVEAQQRLE